MSFWADRASEAPVPVEPIRVRAEALPSPDRAFDSAVVTYSKQDAWIRREGLRR